MFYSFKRVIAILLVSLSTMLATTNAFAVDPVYTSRFSNNAIKGYDTVAYFTQGEAIEGKKEFSTEYMGANWLFSSQEHLDLFVANPEKYAPQYGGYCAYAVAKNSTASIQPDQFTVHEGKLYLNYNKKVNQKWLQDKENFISQADSNWPGILAK